MESSSLHDDALIFLLWTDCLRVKVIDLNIIICYLYILHILQCFVKELQLISMPCTDVLPQVSGLCCFVVTKLAEIPYTIVDSLHMLLDVEHLCRLVITFHAHVIPSIIVNTLVQLEVDILGEGHLTQVTFKRFLTLVKSHVSFQI